MSLAEEFEENVVELKFYKPVISKTGSNATVTTYSGVETFSTMGIFQMTDGDISWTPRGAQIRTTNDVFIDKETASDAMYRAIMDNEEKWRMSYDGRWFLIESMEAAGEAEDPYIIRAGQVKA